MNWKAIKLAEDRSHFLVDGSPIFEQTFLDALKFHAPGLAPVCNASGWFHINVKGKPLYNERYKRAFGYYCNRAAVITNSGWQHLNEEGQPVYQNYYSWCGNYQHDICTVRNPAHQYFHIDLAGQPLYPQRYKYAGDFRNGYACVRNKKGLFTHISPNGQHRHGKFYRNLGVYHKGYATAKDEKGWCHINESGLPVYPHRFMYLEPFYNGQALVTTLEGTLVVIDEQGVIVGV